MSYELRVGEGGTFAFVEGEIGKDDYDLCEEYTDQQAKHTYK